MTQPGPSEGLKVFLLIASTTWTLDHAYWVSCGCSSIIGGLQLVLQDRQPAGLVWYAPLDLWAALVRAWLPLLDHGTCHSHLTEDSRLSDERPMDVRIWQG